MEEHAPDRIQLKNHLSMELAYTEVVNYALQQNKLPVIQKLTLFNEGEDAIEELTMEISSTNDALLPCRKVIDFLPAGGALDVENIQILFDENKLIEFSEKISSTLSFKFSKEENDFGEAAFPLTYLAYDQWHGLHYYPELLTAFILPNSSYASRIVLSASEYLQKWTNNPSFDGYQQEDETRVRYEAAAIYEAIQALSVVYAEPPASFEITGQRIRLCDEVVDKRLGTCMDMTLLYASCLEAVGLNPILIVKRNHIFAGVWLDKNTFPNAVSDDPSIISKRFAEGVREISVVECTQMNAGIHVPFDAAEVSAKKHFDKPDEILYVIDVRQARVCGIRPIPSRIKTDDGWRVDLQKSNEEPQEIVAPEEVEQVEITVEDENNAAPKQLQWERKLLDLGLRNTLINLRYTKRIIPILTTSLPDLEDALSCGKEFSVSPRPEEFTLSADEVTSFEKVTDLKGFDTLIKSEFEMYRLRSRYTEWELSLNIKEVYRNSKSSIEESGANTLYLALGLLRWYESDKSQKARYAPIVLLPIEMVRKSAVRGYVIRLRDEEPVMNITLIEMLKQNFHISIKGLDVLPTDDAGIDVRKVLTIIRQNIMAKKRWDVLESAYIGNFSFASYVMWNDLRNRSEDLSKNIVVSSLMKGSLTWDAEPMLLPEHLEEQDTYLPLPADASQLFAIKEAVKGESFVLHGPPGTGKSQTITAMIANALAEGKTVLFVAEKMAALSVVQKRLNDIGIGPFCLELHSNKSKKSDVLQQLQEALGVRKDITTDFNKRAEELSQIRRNLNQYCKELHAKRQCGYSIYQLIDIFEEYQEADDSVHFSLSEAAELTEEDIHRMNASLDTVFAAAREAGSIYDHPLSFVDEKQYSQTMKYHLPDVLYNLQRSLAVWKDTIAEFCLKVLEMDMIPSKQDMDRCLKIAVASEKLTSFPDDWTRGDDLPTLITQLQSMQQHYQKQVEEKEYLSEYYGDSFLDQDGMQLQETYQQNQELGFFKRMSANRKFMKLLKSFAISGTNKERVAQDLSHLVSYQQEKSELDQQLASVQSQLSNWDGGVYISDSIVRYEALLSRMHEAEETVSTFDSMAGDQSIRAKVIQNKTHLKSSDVYKTVGENLAKTEQEYSKLLSTEPVPAESDYCQTMMERLSALQENLGKIHEWISWNQVAADCREHHLTPVIEAIEKGSALEDVKASYEKNLCKTIVISELDHINILRQFSGMLFIEQIVQFRKCVKEMQKVSREEIYCRLAQKVPDATREASQNSELGILQRAIRSRGRGVSIRKLFGEIPNLLPRLCPCMLMSPMSAAQYLDPSRNPFDIVIFDEASQLTTSKAVGAIARGKSAVIVGDPKQMPPTNFFTTNAVDEEHLEDEDLESILDDCLALGMPQTHLLWHYRSRHESLIRFSNSQFYGNKLYTFPSVNDEEKKVRMVHVDGVFDRGKTRCNEVEAKAAVAEIRRRAMNPKLKGQSIGVVTFNTQQQGLIQDLFDEACDHDSRLNEWNAKAAEPVFIKNLESVQGDERDVIIFSVGYGPDKTGKVTMNFGPLNREGGWRRLNVAVSRARMEMIVIATLQPSQMDLSRTSANGVRQLKAFLEYAKTGSLPLQEQSVRRKDSETSGIVGDICQELRRNGYQVRTQVGHSKFHIDIGVVDPRNDERYLAGILLDGEQYADAKTTTDRELSQIDILNGLGWKLYRIWTLDWWDNKKRETERLILFLKKAEEESISTTIEREDFASGEDDVTEPILESTTSRNSHYDNRSDEGDVVIPPASSIDPTNMPEGKIASNYLRGKHDELAGSVARPLGHGHLFQPADIGEVVYLPDLDDYDAYEILQKNIKIVLEMEAPVSQARLVRVVLASVGISRSGSRVQMSVIRAVNRMQVPVSREDGMIFYWRFDQNKDEYKEYRISGNGIHKRDIQDVPKCEIINAAYDVLDQQVALPEEELITETARILGYRRVGANVRDAITRAISHAIQKGNFKKDNNGKVIL